MVRTVPRNRGGSLAAIIADFCNKIGTKRTYRAPSPRQLALKPQPTAGDIATMQRAWGAQSSPYMSSRADMYRQRAADAKKRSAQAKDLSVKRAFEEVARGSLVLAEQMEWIDRQKSTVHDEEDDRSLC